MKKFLKNFENLFTALSKVVFGYIAFWEIIADKAGKAVKKVNWEGLWRRAKILTYVVLGLLLMTLVFSLLAIAGLFFGWVTTTSCSIVFACITLFIVFAIFGFCSETLSWAILAVIMAKNLVIDPHIWLVEQAQQALEKLFQMGSQAVQTLVRVIAALVPGATVEEMDKAFKKAQEPQKEIEPLLKSAEQTLLKMQAKAQGYANGIKTAFVTYFISATCVFFLNLLFRFGARQPDSFLGWLNAPAVISGMLVLVVIAAYAALVPALKIGGKS